MKKILLSLIVLALMAGTALAQVPAADPGWTAFTIRESTVGAVPPVIQDPGLPYVGATEIAITLGGQKAGLATDQLNGAAISEIARLHLDRLDDVINSGSLYGPYFNIWVTDGAGQYAVLANEPSDAEWAGSRWDVADWNFLKTKRCKVYETLNVGASGAPGTSWVATYATANGWDGVSNLTFEDVAGLVIAPPPPSYIQAGNGVGTGAPDELGTDIAHGYTWVFGDTATNYISGNDGFIVDNYFATTTFNVQNTIQLTSYATIEAALAAANPNDIITIADGTYNPPTTLNIAMPLTITGASEAGVIINIPTAGGYGIAPTANDITLSNFTLVANTTNQNYPIHASGTSNPPSGFTGLTLQHITIQGVHRRTGFDVHGYNNVVLSYLTSKDATGGNGVQITGCVGVTVDNVTTLNNAWGSFAIYVSDVGFLGRPSSNVVIDGATMNFDGAFFSQDEFGFENFNLTVTGWDYEVTNTHFREALGYTDSEGYTFFAADQTAALAIATGFTGYEQYSAIFNTNTGVYEVVVGLTIKAAIAAANSGDTINIDTGTYVEVGQILIDKDISLIGNVVTRPIVMTDGDTGSAGDARGWFLQTAGTHLVLRNLELDGAGYLVYQGIRSFGSGVMDNCAMRNITYNESGPNYQGIALVGAGGNWDVTYCGFDNIGRVGFLAFGTGLTNSSFSHNTYHGKLGGNWLDYACDISAGAVMTVEDNSISGCLGVASSDGSTSAGLLVSTYFAPGTIAAINGNSLTGNSEGVAVGYDGADVSVVTGHGNDLSGNGSYGVSNSSLLNSADFTGNWWGDATGPYNLALNPLGTGVPVGDNILFDPWSGPGTVGTTPATTGPLMCGQTTTLTFSLTTDQYTPDVFGFNAVVRASSEVNWGTIASSAAFGATTQFYTIDNGDGSFAISGTTLGNPQQPISGVGTTDLFTVDFTTAAEGTAIISFDSMTLRDPANAPIPVVATGATITVDCTAPGAVTGITAVPRHNKVDVSWSAGPGPDTATYEVYRGLWYTTSDSSSAYPEYNDLAGDNSIPARPADRNAARLSPEWKYAGTTNVGTTSFQDVGAVSGTGTFAADGADRGVYYYEVFAVDTAGNASLAAAANDRATNYWLGDIVGTPYITPAPPSAPNGVVDPTDMNELSSHFGETGLTVGAAQYVLDVGPTDDWSRVGVPTTDSNIDFEDLMVFSMNFGVVSAAKGNAPISSPVDLAWVTYNDGSQALRLVNGSSLKGLRVRANVPVGSVVAGQLLDDQSELTFLKNVGTNLDVSVAVMGINQAFEGNGDLLIVRSGSGIEVADLHITARGVDNSELKFSMDEASGTLMPRVFALNANYPNPFNPMTKISFSLPEAQDVKLAVYSIDGRKVATLVNETRGPGLHEVVWTGRDDQGQAVSSGMYFYRLDAGPYSQVRKMTLMK